MVKVFVDTNVLIDFLQSSRDKHQAALDFFHIILDSSVEAAISTQSVLDAAYVCSKVKGFNQKQFRSTVDMLTLRTNVNAIDPFNIRTALKDLDPDFEDNVHIAFAYENTCDFIITNDANLLSRQLPEPIKAITPEEFIHCCKA